MGKRRMSIKERRRRQRNRRIIMSILGLVIIGIIWFGILVFFDKRQDRKENNAQEEANITQELIDTPTSTATPTPTPEPLPSVDLSQMSSKSAILMRLSDGQVVTEKDADTRIYPASMTKVMTALIALENLTDLNQLITIDQPTYDKLYLEGASMAGFAPGDQVKAIDMVYGVLLPSGAECCLGLANTLYGSEAAFVEKMNEKAQELGMGNTHFVTSTGLHDPEHYTTCRDLTKLLTYALKNETFRTIYCAHDYTTSPTASNPSGVYFRSTTFKKIESSVLNGGELLGGKTGYTSDAGQCLASLAKVNEVEYILVTAGAPGTPSTEPYHVWDAINIYNQIA